MKYDINENTHPYFLERIRWPGRIHAPIALVCAEKVPHMTHICKLNMFSMDGMHYCTKTIGSRVFAVMSCLLSCVYNNNDMSSSKGESHGGLRMCEEKCNQQYMSLEPIPDNLWDIVLK